MSAQLRRFGCALAFLLLLLAGGCSNSPVAIVNNVRITRAQFQQRMIAAVGRDILKDMIDRELIRQAAEQAGIVVNEEELAQEVARAKEGFPSEEAFQQFLVTRGITEEDWIDEVRMALIARQLTVKDVKYTEQDLRNFFKEHKDRYRLPLRVSLSEIVVATKADADQVMAELKKDPSKFADLARVYSLSPYTKARGGKRPEDYPVDAIQIPEIRRVVSTLPIGQISNPIRVSMNGEEQWYILRVDDRKPPREGSFEKDKEQIIRDYQSVHARPLSEIIREAAQKSNVVVLDPRFQDLNEIYSSAPANLPSFGAQQPEAAGGQRAPAGSGQQPPAQGGQGAQGAPQGQPAPGGQ